MRIDELKPLHQFQLLMSYDRPKVYPVGAADQIRLGLDLPTGPIALRLAGDPRVRLPGEKTEGGKWNARKRHPWLSIEQVSGRQFGVRLTNEGIRRAHLLADLLDQRPPKQNEVAA